MASVDVHSSCMPAPFWFVEGMESTNELHLSRLPIFGLIIPTQNNESAVSIEIKQPVLCIHSYFICFLY